MGRLIPGKPVFNL